MLSKEENALLTQVGPGTPMGDLMRQYWLPVLFSDELEAGVKPKRVKLLGEPLVAFRGQDGEPGLLAEFCAHRGVSLYFGRLEQCGMRCVYHGWAFDRRGRCLEMPSEPPESTFRDRVRMRGYPCAEWGGVIWAYLGPENPPPPLPDLEWTLLPSDHRFVSKRVQECNWFQALEGGIDSAHISFLHAPLSATDTRTLADIDKGGFGVALAAQTGDTRPHFDVRDTDYGVLIGACRGAADSQHYWRITQFLMPFYTMPPTSTEDPLSQLHAWVPMDDDHVVNWMMTWHPRRPLTGDEVMAQLGGKGSHVTDYAPPTSDYYGDIRPRANKANDYFMDWEAHRTRLYCGIPGFGMQDQALQESAGGIVDRSQEHLGTSDTAIIRVRRRVMNAARALHDHGEVPPGREPHLCQVRSASLILPPDVDWVDAAMEQMTIEPGYRFAYA